MNVNSLVNLKQENYCHALGKEPRPVTITCIIDRIQQSQVDVQNPDHTSFNSQMDHQKDEKESK